MRKWIVRCANYEAGPFTSQEVAQQRMDAIVAQGACDDEEHEVVEVESSYRMRHWPL
jgi:hypothetical protein